MDLQQRQQQLPKELQKQRQQYFDTDRESDIATTTTNNKTATEHTSTFQTNYKLSTTSHTDGTEITETTATTNPPNIDINKNIEEFYESLCWKHTKDVRVNGNGKNEVPAKGHEQNETLFIIWCEQTADMSAPTENNETKIPEITRHNVDQTAAAVTEGATKNLAQTIRCILKTFEATSTAAKTTTKYSTIQYSCYNTDMSDYFHHPSNTTCTITSNPHNINNLSSFTQQHQ